MSVENGNRPNHYHIVKGSSGTRELLTHDKYFMKEQPGRNSPITIIFDELKHRALRFSERMI